jgi:AcrR family transcriptional regulator
VAAGSAAPPPAEASPQPAEASPQQVEATPVPPPAFSSEEAIALALSKAQLTAIEKILSGHTIVASASAAGVTRMTIYNWLRNDAKFQAAYNAWQLDALTAARTKILAMSDTAVTTIGRAVKTDARIALTVLKAMGVLDRPTPGSSDPEEIAKIQTLERRRVKKKLEEEIFFDSVGNFGDEPSA